MTPMYLSPVLDDLPQSWEGTCSGGLNQARLSPGLASRGNVGTGGTGGIVVGMGDAGGGAAGVTGSWAEGGGGAAAGLALAGAAAQEE